MIEQLEADYLVIGSGAMGMAFTDELLTQNPQATVILVDQHAKPGGHWNNAYPFVSLHQPAAYYGVNSEKLGTGGAALASGTEVLAYFERVLNKFTRTGRVRYFPMCEYQAAGAFRSTMEPDLSYQVNVRRKTVDTTYMNVEVPSMREPPFPVAAGISIVPPNALPKVSEPHSGYVVIGAGKTGMDAVLFLLNQGIAPGHITWIISNDAWLLDRATLYPDRLIDFLEKPLECFVTANTLKELYTSLEAKDMVLRLDSNIWPTKYRCATVNQEELAQLRQIKNIVRMGRVERIASDTIVLTHGSLPTDSGKLHIDCTANGLSRRPALPVFAGNTITLQSLFMCQQVFSAAVVGYVEARYSDEFQKNELCQPVPHPEEAGDYLVGTEVSLANSLKWTRAFGWWLMSSRLYFPSHVSKLKFLWSAVKTRKVLPAAQSKLRQIIESEQESPAEGPVPTSQDNAMLRESQ